ncbi:MAG TPA: class E sortase [Iamia sp.]
MTVLDQPREETPAPDETAAPPEPPSSPLMSSTDTAAETPGEMPSPRAIVAIVAAWLVLLVLATAAVLYPLGPLFQRREQHELLRGFRVEVQQAADAKEGLAGLLDAEEPLAPEVGQSVAILDLGRVRVQQVVVEGVGPDQTRRGPGHVPGTAGLGQPGNSVVVGRRSGWGGPFDELGSLREGDEIVATTLQGQTVYVVRSVEERRLQPEELYGPSDDDRLTLVTSASRSPFATDRAIVVEAGLDGRPFEPTPQGGRAASIDGRQGDTGGWAPLALFGTGFAVAAVLAAVLYRRWRPLTAYLLTTPALVVMAILTGESVLRLLPAWT